MLKKKAKPSCRISSSVRLCWELEEPKGPNGRMEGIEAVPFPLGSGIQARGTPLCPYGIAYRGTSIIRNRKSQNARSLFLI